MRKSVVRKQFGETPTGERVDLFTLRSADGIEISIISYGAAVQSALAPGRDGSRANVALGFPVLGGYVAPTRHYFGAVVGRYANRISGGRFALDGVEHALSRNDGDNCLHGGACGFDTRVWEILEASGGMLVLAYTSPEGEMGFPGTLETRVEYRLAGRELRIDYRATTSAPTVVNLTNHTCWNLAGEGTGSVDDHVLQLHASSFTPVRMDLVPTGEIAAVDDTPLDFRTPTRVGERRRGYDHNFVLDTHDGSLAAAAHVLHPASGRTLDVFTTEPGIQLYTGTILDGTLIGTSGSAYRKGDCIALETQHFPDSPNHPAFPSTTLRPGESFASTTVYRFGVHGSSSDGTAEAR